MRGTTAALVIAMVFTIAPRATAQSRATAADLIGTVRDQTGAVLAGATIAATNTDTNVVRTVATGDDGRFMIPALAPGTYTVRAERSGFVPQLLKNIVLTLGASVDLPITLQVGLQESLTVVAETPVVDTKRTAISSVIVKEQIDNLPTNGRNFMAFSLLTPGVATDRTPQQGVSETTGLTFAGQHARSNNITIDGLDNNEFFVGGVREAFSQEAVREFQVLTNAYSAEFGKASGGVVNIVTKSGTNMLKGNLFVFLRDDSLNSKGHFEEFDLSGNAIDRGKAPYTQKQFGGTFGGPVKRDETFFFGSVERLAVTASNFVSIDDQTVVMHPFLGTPLGTAAQILRNAGFPVETGQVPYSLKSNQVLGRIDHQLSANQNLNVRVGWSNALNDNIEPFGAIVAKSRAGTLDNTNGVIAGSLASVVSPKNVNELRFQVAKQNSVLNSLDPNCGGPCEREDQGGPNVEVTGFASVGRLRTTPTVRNSVRYQIVDTFTHYRGAHEFKGGIDFSDINVSKYAVPLSFGGRFIFGSLSATPGLLPGPVSAIQAVALGLPAAYVQGYGNSTVAFNSSDISLFAQDDWRVTPRLTAKLGLRYQSQFWPDAQFRVPGYPGAYSFPQDRNNLAPRIALAWEASQDRKTSVHASYGIFYDNNFAALRAVPSIVDGSSGVRTLALRFPLSIPAWTAPGHQLSESAVGPYPSVRITIDPQLKTPYAHHTAVGITRDLPDGTSLSANVLYVRGFNLVGTIDYNPLVPSLGAGRRPEDVGGVAGTSTSILQYSSFGRTWYRGLTLSLIRRVTARSQMLASYTWSKAEDTSTDFQSAFIVQDNGRGRSPADPQGLPLGFDPLGDKGLANHDQRHRLVVSGAYLLPASFQASAIFTVGSGRPFNILAGADLDGDGDGGAFPSDRARTNPADSASSLPRNSGTMPAQATLDTRISRKFRVGNSANLDVILEAFNLFNRVNFTEANNIFGRGAYPTAAVPAFGRFEQTGPPRQLQLAAKFNF